MLTGEFFIKLDIKYNLTHLNEYNIKKQNPNILDKSFIDNKKFKIHKNQIRIMILGDSYIEGIGINKSLRFNNQLANILEKHKDLNKKPIILSLTQPGFNAIDKYFSFLDYYEKFKPHFVLWFHSLNDISFSYTSEFSDIKQKLAEKKDNAYNNIEKKNIASITETINLNHTNNKSKFYNLKTFISKSDLLYYLSSNLFNEILLRGFLIPYGDFYYLTQSLYNNSTKQFKLYKDIFKHVFIKINKNTKLIVYSMPEYNLINQTEFFKNVDSTLYNFFKEKNAIYIDGKDHLMGYKFNQLVSTRSDGHPNSLAHKIITKKVSDLIVKTYIKK